MEEWKGQGSSLASWVECICIYKLPLKEERQNMLGELQSVLVSSCCCTNYHKYSSLIQCNLLSYSSAVQKFETGLWTKIGCHQSAFLFGGSREESVFPAFPSFYRPPISLDLWPLSMIQSQQLHNFVLCFCSHVSFSDGLSCLPLSLIKTLVMTVELPRQSRMIFFS